MVAIRRVRPQRSGGIFSLSTAGPILLCLLLVILVQALRLIWRISSESGRTPSTNNINNPESSSVHQVLQDYSHGRARVNQLNRPPRPKKVPSVAIPIPKPVPRIPKHHDFERQHEDNELDGGVHHREHDPGTDSVDIADEHNVHEQKNDAPTEMVLTKHGSGPTKVGYVVDLAYERQHPAFRLGQSVTAEYLKHLEEIVAQKLELKEVHSCERDGNKHYCRDDDARLVAYNEAPFERHLCGSVLKPGKSMILEGDDCHWQHESMTAPPPIHLLPQDAPPLSGHGMPPVVITTMGKESPANLESVTCDIPCQWESDALRNTEPGEKIVDLTVQGTDWKLTWTDADPASEKRAQMERIAYRRQEYYATTSWQSSIPLSTFDFNKYDFHKAPAVHFYRAKGSVASVLSDQCSGTPIRRQKWMGSLTSVLPKEKVAFYGACQHTTDVPSGLSLDKQEDRIALLKQHRIAIAFEAGTEKWHVTPIVWEALMSGAVPAILGASNLDGDILPPHAALYAANFNSWDEFSKRVEQVLDDNKLWESYQIWRSDPTALLQLEERLNFTRTSPQCRTCRWAYAKLYGLGWNTGQQRVQANTIPRDKLCVSNKRVTKPFVESWYKTEVVVPTISDGDSTCQELFVFADMRDDLGLSRTVWHHDGFTDISVTLTDEQLSDSVTLRLKVPIRNNNEGAIFRHVHTLVRHALRTPGVSSAAIQDEVSKMTVLGNFVAIDMRSPAEGVLEIVIPRSSREAKIRVITEDIDTLHDKLTEYYPSSYALMVMKDFIDPIDLFYVAS